MLIFKNFYNNIFNKGECMKVILIGILNNYLLLFPEEQQRQSTLINYLNQHKDEELTDWNNFDGHIVAGGFIYAKEEDKFLVLYHNDLKMFLYPGGHVDNNDINPLTASKREILEETGLKNLEQLKLSENELIPIDIDTHKIGYNERLNLPEHYHFDFRYLFMVDRISDIKTDTEELSSYKWISVEELSSDPNYEMVASKIKKVVSNNKKLGR